MEENQITKQYSTMTLENLFKHNIFFTPMKIGLLLLVTTILVLMSPM